MKSRRSVWRQTNCLCFGLRFC